MPVAVPVAIGLGWAVALTAEVGGFSEWLGHEKAFEGDLPAWAASLVFLAAWPLMIAAMMLPSSVPMVRLFATVSSAQTERRRVLAAFLGGYALVWGVFGALAFAGDAVLHEVVHRTAWLGEREWLIGGGALASAGAFQFSRLKDACLDQCRHPGAFLMPRYRQGTGEAFRLGRAHGLFCLGCCWALMLLMFAAGLADLRWMAALGALMAYEKVGRHGRAVVPVAGVALLIWAGLVLAHPGWLPEALAGVV